MIPLFKNAFLSLNSQKKESSFCICSDKFKSGNLKTNKSHTKKSIPLGQFVFCKKKKKPNKTTNPTSNNRKEITKAAVGTHSELLAAASPCRQTSRESTEPVAHRQSSGQVVTREAGQEMGTCSQDAVGTVGPTELPHFPTSWWWEGAAGSELCP